MKPAQLQMALLVTDDSLRLFSQLKLVFHAKRYIFYPAEVLPPNVVQPSNGV